MYRCVLNYNTRVALQFTDMKRREGLEIFVILLLHALRIQYDHLLLQKLVAYTVEEEEDSKYFDQKRKEQG